MMIYLDFLSQGFTHTSMPSLHFNDNISCSYKHVWMCQSSQSFHDSQIGMPPEENTGATFFFKQEVQYCAKVIQTKYSKFQSLLYQINILFEQRMLFC